eukprot:11081475-Alexandrium_andersonii.AAC.1
MAAPATSTARPGKAHARAWAGPSDQQRAGLLLGVATSRTPEDEDARKDQEASGASACASVPRAC